MKTQLMNNSKVVVAIMIILASTNIAEAQSKKDFSGSWVINISKSNFDTLKTDIAPTQIVAKQLLPSIELIKTFEHPGAKPNSYTQAFTYDGKPSERMAGAERRVTTISTSNDILVFDTKGYVDNNGFKWEYIANEKWTLSDGGKTLSILRKAILPNRTEVYTAVYDKQ